MRCPRHSASIRDGGLTATVEQCPGGQSAEALEAMVGLPARRHQARAADAADAVAITKDNIDKAERLGEVQ